MVQEVEDQLGVIVGVMNNYADQEMVVTLVGPQNRVEVAKMVLGG